MLRAQITGLEDRDIVFMRFEGEGGRHCLPYFIALDHEEEAVVVSIRGTLSLEDAVTGAAQYWGSGNSKNEGLGHPNTPTWE